MYQIGFALARPFTKSVVSPPLHARVLCMTLLVGHLCHEHSTYGHLF